ncbi:MAG: glycosyltransferase family 4 protein [Bacteroidales bacterium]|nr:glycosyltransferase family 4 protein [Bacteroidales bacterium]
MKLLYIHQYFIFPEMSGGTRSYDLATSFCKKGIEVIVITSEKAPKKNSKRWTEFERDGIKFFVLNCPYDNTMGFWRRIASFSRFFWFASFKALKIKCDIVLATSTPLTIAIPALVRNILKKTPYIFEVRDVWPEVPVKMGYINNKYIIKLLYWFEKLVYKRASWIVPLSLGMKQNIEQRYPNQKSIVIPNISEISRFNNIENSVNLPVDIQGKKIVLYAGTFGEANGVDYLVNLANMTLDIDNSIIYLLYGKGKQLVSVLDSAKKKGVLNNNLYYGGVVSKSELPYLNSICTVACSTFIDNPVLWDNSANKFFDSLAAGRPIMINYLGWQSDIIKHYNAGYVLPAKLTEKSIADFVKYINDKKLITEQSVRAHSLAKSEYSLEVAVEKYMKIFEAIQTNRPTEKVRKNSFK